MSDEYDWKTHWQETRRDGGTILDVRPVEGSEYLTVSSWDRMHVSYLVQKNGLDATHLNSGRDLLPVVPEPVLVPWTQATFPLECWLRGSEEASDAEDIVPHGRVEPTGIIAFGEPYGWARLLSGCDYTLDSVEPRLWKPCGTLEDAM